jgi:uncharacterized membrane protein (DUF373 family)
MLAAIVVTVLLQLVLIYWSFAQRIFNTTALSTRDLALCFGLALTVIVVVELWKAAIRWRRRRQQSPATAAAGLG